ncbi:MAG: diguanylate cyclase [Treponema sp.]|nr:diguanylate cyclase [Treponema sp.]
MENEKKYCIMIADDDKASLDILSSILMNEYDLRIVRNGKAVLEQVADSPPDLLLLDVMIPGLTGFEVLAHLKQVESTHRIPVIFITSLNGEDYEEKGLRLGAVDYITKPFNRGIMLARIRSQIQIVRYIREIERLGMIDALTDIPNRRNFDIRIREEWRRETRTGNSLSMMMVDIDFFKHYNDTYGHPQGDILLRSLASLFTVHLKRPSDFVARLGGEEFAILLPEANREGAAVMAERIRAATEEMAVPVADQKKDTNITISIGVATLIPDKNTPVEELVEKADKNLYAAKAAGRNRVVAG